MKHRKIGDWVAVQFAGEWCLGQITAIGGGGFMINMEKYGPRWFNKPKLRRADAPRKVVPEHKTTPEPT